MKIIAILLLFILFSILPDIQGNWKLKEFTAFMIMLNSPNFNTLTEEQQKKFTESIQFTLDNTYYRFSDDSVFFTDAGGENLIKKRKGRWLIKSDTLIIVENDKFKIHKFLITSLKKDELKLRFVYKDGLIGPTEMTFSKVD